MRWPSQPGFLHRTIRGVGVTGFQVAVDPARAAASALHRRAQGGWTGRARTDKGGRMEHARPPGGLRAGQMSLLVLGRVVMGDRLRASRPHGSGRLATCPDGGQPRTRSESSATVACMTHRCTRGNAIQSCGAPEVPGGSPTTATAVVAQLCSQPASCLGGLRRNEAVFFFGKPA